MLYLLSVRIAGLRTCFQLHFHGCGATQTDAPHTVCLRGQHGNAKPTIRPVRHSTHHHQFNELQNKAHSQFITRFRQFAISYQDYPNPHVQENFAQTPPKSQDIPEGEPYSLLFFQRQISLHCFPAAKAILPGPRAARANAGFFFFFSGQTRVKLPQRQLQKSVNYTVFQCHTKTPFFLYKRGNVLKEENNSLLLLKKICRLQLLTCIFLEVVLTTAG